MANDYYKRAFVAGASGAIGEILCQLLLADGWHVVGTTRSNEKAARLQNLEVQPVVIDVFDRPALIQAVCDAKPDVVVNQLTDLPRKFTPENMAAAQVRNARIRDTGTKNLVDAAIAAGATRIVSQSIAFAYLPGPLPYSEDAPLDTVEHPSIIKLEEYVLGCGLIGIILRYGRLYGPNTWSMDPPKEAPVHVDAAANAARLSMNRGSSGVYNIAEDDGTVSITKAMQELNWNPDFRVSWPV